MLQQNPERAITLKVTGPSIPQTWPPMNRAQLDKNLPNIFHRILGLVQQERYLPELRIERIEEPFLRAFESTERVLWTYECIGIGTCYPAIVRYAVFKETDAKAILASGVLCCVEA